MVSVTHRERSLKDLISSINKGAEKLRGQTHGSVTTIRTGCRTFWSYPQRGPQSRQNHPMMLTVSFPGTTSYEHIPDDLGGPAATLHRAGWCWPDGNG